MTKYYFLLILIFFLTTFDFRSSYGEEYVITTITVGMTPYGIITNNSTNKIYVANSAANTVSVIDGNTDEVVKTIGVDKYPSGIDINDLANKIYRLDIHIKI